MEIKLIAVSVSEADKEQFKKELSKLHGAGKINSSLESRFVRSAINEKLNSLNVDFKI